MDMEKYHQESTRKDFETYALVEYFKLLKMTELADEGGYPIFKLIGGEHSLIVLEMRAKDGYFDCKRNNKELFNDLLRHMEILRRKSQTVFIEEAIFNGEVIKNFIELPEELWAEDALMTLTRKFQGYPVDVIAPFLAILMNGPTQKEKEKTIGQKQIETKI